MATKKLRPVHPGDILRHDFLEPLGISAYRLAKELGVSTPTVAQLVARRRNVSAQMALRLARYFGTSAQVWQNLQAQYDLKWPSPKSARRSHRRDGRAPRANPFVDPLLPDR